MSLDVYLISTTPVKKRCTHCGSEYEEFETLYDANITHNLTKMADAAGIYLPLWRSDEVNIKTASQLIPLLEVGLKELESKPDHYKQFNSENGWGNYDNLVAFVGDYLKQCQKYPEALIDVSR